MSITLIIHIYYPGSWLLIKNKCNYLINNASQIIITVCNDTIFKEIDLKDALILITPNKGKDIGGKMAALNYYLHFGQKTDLLAYVHDKISPQTLNAEFWLDELLSIFQEANLKKILNIFKQKHKIGIIGNKTFLNNEFKINLQEFKTTNNFILKDLIKRYQLNGSKYNFIAGTIFICRSSIHQNFFTRFSPLSIRKELEAGNVLDLNSGTFTHSWERILAFIAEDQGYNVFGI